MGNHWVVNPVIKPVDAESFQRIKYENEGGNEKNDDFDMDILEEGYLDKALNAEKKTPEEKKTRKIYMS